MRHPLNDPEFVKAHIADEEAARESSRRYQAERAKIAGRGPLPTNDFDPTRAHTSQVRNPEAADRERRELFSDPDKTAEWRRTTLNPHHGKPTSAARAARKENE